MKRFPRCIMGTCCVLWDEEERFAEAVFRRGVRTALEGTSHLYVFGTAGEGHAVTERQFDQVVAAFVDEMRKAGAEPMVGVIHLSAAMIIERIERCRDAGVRLFQISLPSWSALNDGELFRFFDAVCGRFPDCRFMHYNLPRAKRLVTGQEYGRLAEAHPNLVATKNTGDSLSHIRGLLEDAPQLQHFLSESGYVYGSLFAECSLLASLVMNWPKLHSLFEAGRRCDVDTLVSLQHEINVVRRTLFEIVPEGRSDGAYDKLFARLYDPEFPLRLLSPTLVRAIWNSRRSHGCCGNDCRTGSPPAAVRNRGGSISRIQRSPCHCFGRAGESATSATRTACPAEAVPNCATASPSAGSSSGTIRRMN